MQPPSIAAAKSVTVSNRKRNQFTVSWNQIKGVTGYEVYLRKAGTRNYTKSAVTSTNAGKAVIKKLGKKPLSAGTKYEVIVRAYKKAKNEVVYGSFSKMLTTSTILKRPDISLKSSNRKLMVQWKPDKQAEGYEVYLSTRKNKSYQKQKTVSAGKTKFISSKLSANKTYYVKVRAYQNVNGKKVYSDYSRITSIRTNL